MELFLQRKDVFDFTANTASLWLWVTGDLLKKSLFPVLLLHLLLSCHTTVLINHSLTGGCLWNSYSVETCHTNLYRVSHTLTISACHVPPFLLQVSNDLTQKQRMVEGGRNLWRSLYNTPAQTRLSNSQLPRITSRWLLNISKDGKPTTSLGNLCQGSVTLRGKKCFLRFRGNHSCFRLCPLPSPDSVEYVHDCLVLRSPEQYSKYGLTTVE